MIRRPTRSTRPDSPFPYTTLFRSSIVVDPLTSQGVDADHPAVGPEVGLEGCSLPTLRDSDRLLDGVDLSKVDTAWHWAALAYPMVASVHVKRGQPLETLQGSNMPDMLQQTLCGWGQALMPTDLCHRTTVDEIEFSVKNRPRWAPGMPQAYDLRERGDRKSVVSGKSV